MSADPLDFDGARAVVTGAAGAIGRATAELLLERRAAVVATDLSAAGLAPLAAAGAETVACDVADVAGRAALTAAAGPCHYLVNAAGMLRPKPIAETTEADWDAIMAVNAKAVYFLCQAFGELLMNDGAIVNVSSVSARVASSQEQSVYCASKAAVSSVTRSFAYLYSPRGIRVNAVLPGIVDTPMQDTFLEVTARARRTTPELLHAARLRLVALGRSASTRECAETIVWLLSPAASYLTGQQIAPDGGLTMF